MRSREPPSQACTVDRENIGASEARRTTIQEADVAAGRFVDGQDLFPRAASWSGEAPELFAIAGADRLDSAWQVSAGAGRSVDAGRPMSQRL